MTKHGFEEFDLHGMMGWAIQTYNKWLDGRPKCVDIRKLKNYIQSASTSTGFQHCYFTCIVYKNINCDISTLNQLITIQ